MSLGLPGLIVSPPSPVAFPVTFQHHWRLEHHSGGVRKNGTWTRRGRSVFGIGRAFSLPAEVGQNPNVRLSYTSRFLSGCPVWRPFK